MSKKKDPVKSIDDWINKSCDTAKLKRLKLNNYPIKEDNFYIRGDGKGIGYRFSFDNGYGASIIKGTGSYGYPDKWELAILKDGSLCYDSGICDDVIGWQTDEQIEELLNKIKELPNEE